MKTWIPTPEQADVIGFGDGALLVLAGPGSGKTKVLAERVVRLLWESEEQTFRILALTFTNRAAEHMLAGVRERLDDSWRRTRITTFHAFALDVIQRHGGHIGLQPNLTIFDTAADRLAVLQEAIRDDGFTQPVAPVKLREALHRIGRCKHELVTPLAAPGCLLPGLPLAAAYAAYDAALRRMGAVDFDDLLVLCFRLFTEAPRVATFYRRMFRYILVDEAQDTNRAQYQLLRALCGDEHRNIMLVADGDQHIYGFTGASHRYLAMFRRDFAATVKSLTVNFRWAPTIVEVANRLIGYNLDRLPRTPATSRRADAPDAVQLVEHATEEAEAGWIADEIQALLARGDVEGPDDLAVLGRNRYVLDPVRKRLAERGVPFVFGAAEEDLWASKEGLLLHWALQVLHNPTDLRHLESLGAVLGLDVQLQLAQVVDRDMLGEAPSLLGWLERSVTKRPWPSVFGLLASVAVAGRTEDIQGYLRSLCDLVEGGSEATERELVRMDMDLLKQQLDRLYAASEDGAASLSALLGEVALSTARPQEERGVRLLTVHAAKGLEFDVVWLVGMNQGSFPDYRSVRDPQALEEERRAAYVAVTRAGRKLVLSRPLARRMPWGDERTQEPSQFLAEMGVATSRVAI